MRISGLTVSPHPMLSYTQRMLLSPPSTGNVQQTLVGALRPYMKRTMIWQSVKPCFPPTDNALYEKHGYSAAVRSDDLLFVSGQVGSRADGSPEPGFEAQVRQAFANLEATLLSRGGCTFDDIIDVTIVPYRSGNAALGAVMPL